MKKIVVYNSGTGFTRKYANWISEELGCEAREYKDIKKDEMVTYEMVIYGGWIMGNMVYGYDKIKNLELKNVIVFGVGMSVPSINLSAIIAEQNQISIEKFFYFEGGYNPQKQGFVKRSMMNMIKKSIEKKEEKTKEDLHMLETFKGADNSNKDAIKPLIKLVNMGEV